MPSTQMRIRNVNRTQTHRRQVYSDRNAATLSRLQRQAEVGRQREQAAQPPDIGNILDRTDDNYPFNAQQESANWNQAEDKSEWGNFSKDEPDEIDLAMASYKEQYRQKAQEYNWNILLGQLHAEYMKLKNPHDPEGRKFTVQFFKQQWAAQRSFQGDHNEEELTRRAKLVSLYKQEETLELMRARLQSPEIFLESPDHVRQLMDSIVECSETLRIEREEIAGSSAVETGETQAPSERQPLINSMGSRIGTRGKEKIIKAMKARQPAVKKVIDAFNQLYTKYKAKYPNQQLSDAEDHPLTYQAFSKWPMDHRFWNDGLYYHSSAPWSIDPDVWTGINCVLILQRTREEFELIAQELARAKGWAVAHHTKIKSTIDYINTRVDQLQNNQNLDTDYIDDIMLGDLTRKAKMKVICSELQLRLKEHEELICDWSDDLVWLWSRCQPINNQHSISEWHTLIQQIEQLESQTVPAPDIDEILEDAVLDVNVDDGEDVEDNLISDAES
ncbi:hypothetical protein PtA15_8A569 [Puccinia triticina]|uniref:Uncharacterized protein n=1 Tax=Puccinia triticina TaxID=208348 RepID=A0ABY7CRV6_9BASI|nr:uncharacterized protein PtA15_8A569 [Puccinia triticina]WAQ87663.1 hypothetical protein PtA15_8A569 [Puccinia triticina]